MLRIGFGSFTQTAHTHRYSIKSFAFGYLSKSVSPLAFALHSPWVHTPKTILSMLSSALLKKISVCFSPKADSDNDNNNNNNNNSIGWESLITWWNSNPYFSTLANQIHHCLHIRLKVMESLIQNPTFISTHEYSHIPSLIIPIFHSLIPLMKHTLLLDYVCTCNGVFCLSDDSFSYTCRLCLWNPFVRKLVHLPCPIVNKATDYALVTLIGFGFDPNSNDYKVVKLLKLGNREKV